LEAITIRWDERPASPGYREVPTPKTGSRPKKERKAGMGETTTNRLEEKLTIGVDLGDRRSGVLRS